MAVSVRDKVMEILAEQALIEVAELSDTATLEELGIDSMALVEVIFAIEEAFDISVPFNANAPDASDFDISNVAAIVGAVEALVADQVS